MAAPHSVSISLPRDLSDAPGGPVKRLAVVLRAEAPATSSVDLLAVAWVWKTCAFLAMNVRPDALGRLPGEDRLLFESEFPADFGEVVPLMVRSGLLVADDGGWVCPLFTAHNEHLTGRRGKLDPRMGGVMKDYWRRVGLVMDAGPEQLGLLPADHFCTPDNVPFSSDRVQGIQALLIALDSVTDRSVPRNLSYAPDWPVDTVRAAALVLALKPLSFLLDMVADLRRLDLIGHPVVPRTTELCLSRFEALMALVLRVRADRDRH